MDIQGYYCLSNSVCCSGANLTVYRVKRDIYSLLLTLQFSTSCSSPWNPASFMPFWHWVHLKQTAPGSGMPIRPSSQSCISSKSDMMSFLPHQLQWKGRSVLLAW